MWDGIAAAGCSSGLSYEAGCGSTRLPPHPQEDVRFVGHPGTCRDTEEQSIFYSDRERFPSAVFHRQVDGIRQCAFRKSRYRHDHLYKDESGVLGKMPSCKSEVEKMFH